MKLKFQTRSSLAARLSEQGLTDVEAWLLRDADDSEAGGIVSSNYTLDDHYQPDGSIWVFETHEDHLGGVHRQSYLALAGDTTEAKDARLAARAAWIEEKLAEAEARSLLNG